MALADDLATGPGQTGPSRLTGLLDQTTASRAALLDQLDRGMRVDPRVAQQADVDAFNSSSEFTKGLRRFGYSASATTQAFLGQMAEPFAPDFAKRQFGEAQQTMQQMPQSLRPEFETFDQAKAAGLRGLGSYAASALGEGLPSTALMLAGGLGGRAVGALAGRAGLGQAVGGIGSMIPMEGGETALNLQQSPQALANTSPAERAALTLGRGSVNAALENVVPQMLVAPRLLGKAARIGPGIGNAARNTALVAGEGALGEYGTEFAQDLTGQGVMNYAAPGTGYDLGQANEAGIKGAIVGGVTGGAGGVAQGVYSNLGAAADKATDKASQLRPVLDRTVERLDQMINDPKQFGADMANMTLDGMADLAAKAENGGKLFGKGLVKGADVLSDLKTQVDKFVINNVSPENREKYAELTSNLRLLNPAEAQFVRQALTADNLDQAQEYLGTAAKLFADRAGESAKGTWDWLKNIGAGVSEALDNRRDPNAPKQSFVSYSDGERRDLEKQLKEADPGTYDLLRKANINERRQLSNLLLSAADNPSYLAATDDNGTPLRKSVLDGWRQSTGTDLQEVVDKINAQRNAKTLSKAEAKAGQEGDVDQELMKMERRQVGAGVGNTGQIIDSMVQRTPEVELAEAQGRLDGVTYDAEGNPVVAEKWDGNRSPFDRDAYRASMVNQQFANRKDTTVPVQLSSDQLNAQQLAQIFGKKVKGVDGKDAVVDLTKGDTSRVNPNKPLSLGISPMSLAAMVKTQGFRERFADQISEYSEGADNNKQAAESFMSALAILNDRGIEIDPTELGLPAGDMIKIKANVDLNSLPKNLIIRKAGRGQRAYTLGDYMGQNREKLNDEQKLERKVREDAKREFASVREAYQNGDLSREDVEALATFYEDNSNKEGAARTLGLLGAGSIDSSMRDQQAADLRNMLEEVDSNRQEFEGNLTGENIGLAPNKEADAALKAYKTQPLERANTEKIAGEVRRANQRGERVRSRSSSRAERLAARRDRLTKAKEAYKRAALERVAAQVGVNAADIVSVDTNDELAKYVDFGDLVPALIKLRNGRTIEANVNSDDVHDAISVLFSMRRQSKQSAAPTTDLEKTISDTIADAKTVLKLQQIGARIESRKDELGKDALGRLRTAWASKRDELTSAAKARAADDSYGYDDNLLDDLIPEITRSVPGEGAALINRLEDIAGMDRGDMKDAKLELAGVDDGVYDVRIVSNVGGPIAVSANKEFFDRLQRTFGAPTAQPKQSVDNTPPAQTSDVKAEREKFIKAVEKLVGKRIAFRFNQRLKEGVAGTYESRDQALERVREYRRRALAGLNTPASQRKSKLSDEDFQKRVDAADAEEKRILEDKAIMGVIRVAAGMESKAGLAEHEAFHGAFAFFFDKNPEDRRVLGLAFSQGLVAKRLREYFKDNKDVLKAIANDPEEAAAYGFQVWMHDPNALKLGEKVNTIFEKVKDFFRKLFGLMTPEQRALLILEDLKSGRRAERGTSPLAKQLDKDRPWADRAQDYAKDIGGLVKGGYDMLLTGVYNRLINMENPVITQIAKLGYQATGEEGKAGMVQRTMSENKRRLNEVARIFRDLTDAELLELHNAKIFDKAPTDPKLKERWDALNEMYKELYKYQEDAGIEMNNAGIKSNYYPLTWDPEKVLKNKEAFLAMLEKYADKMATVKKTPTEIWEGITGYLERGEDFVNVMGTDNEPISEHTRTRTLAFIAREDRRAFMTDDPIATAERYVKQAVRQAEFVRTFGMSGSKLKNMKEDAKKIYKATDDQIALVDDYIDGLIGNKEVGMSRELKDLYGGLTVYQNVRLLPFSIFSSLIDPLGIAVRSNSIGDAWDTFSYSLKNLFKEWKSEYTRDQWEAIAEDWGVIERAGTTNNTDSLYNGVTLRGTTKKINDAFFKYNLLNGWIRNNHIMAVKAAQQFMHRAAEGEVFKPEQSQRYMDELGVSKDDIVYSKSLGRILMRKDELVAAGKSEADATAIEERLRDATQKFVRQALLNPTAAELPNWASNPYLAPIAHLKQFVWAFNATIVDRVQNELENANYKPLMLAAAYVPGMIAADFLKDMVSNFGDEPPYKKDWGVVDYVISGINRSGFTGTGAFFHDMQEDIMRGGSGYESFAGPSLEQLKKGLSALSSGDDSAMYRWMVKAMPANAVYDQVLLD